MHHSSAITVKLADNLRQKSLRLAAGRLSFRIRTRPRKGCGQAMGRGKWRGRCTPVHREAILWQTHRKFQRQCRPDSQRLKLTKWLGLNAGKGTCRYCRPPRPRKGTAKTTTLGDFCDRCRIQEATLLQRAKPDLPGCGKKRTHPQAS